MVHIYSIYTHHIYTLLNAIFVIRNALCSGWSDKVGTVSVFCRLYQQLCSPELSLSLQTCSFQKFLSQIPHPIWLQNTMIKSYESSQKQKQQQQLVAAGDITADLQKNTVIHFSMSCCYFEAILACMCGVKTVLNWYIMYYYVCAWVNLSFFCLSSCQDIWLCVSLCLTPSLLSFPTVMFTCHPGTGRS